MVEGPAQPVREIPRSLLTVRLRGRDLGQQRSNLGHPGPAGDRRACRQPGAAAWGRTRHCESGVHGCFPSDVGRPVRGNLCRDVTLTVSSIEMLAPPEAQQAPAARGPFGSGGMRGGGERASSRTVPQRTTSPTEPPSRPDACGGGRSHLKAGGGQRERVCEQRGFREWDRDNRRPPARAARRPCITVRGQSEAGASSRRARYGRP